MGLFSKLIDRQLAAYQRELIETHYREIRGWRHDYRNHIQTMKAYAAAGDWEAIRTYLDLLDEDLTACNSSPPDDDSSPECAGGDFLCYTTPEMR